MSKTEMLEKSIIVCAHPDDEVLWFSSIIDKVDEVVICFLNQLNKPYRGIQRNKVLSEYPMKNVSCLGIVESKVFNGANWQNPRTSKYGIEISNETLSDKEYKENYYKLKIQLENKLMDYINIVTHNPWGEYGSEEHIQVYKVLKELQGEMKFNLWFGNYCSNKSFNLMLRYISGFNSEYVTLKTNIVLGNKIKELYKRNECWTWYDDWEWFNEESFMKDRNGVFEERINKYGHIFPLNLIKLKPPSESWGKSKVLNKFTSKISRTLLSFFRAKIVF